MKELEPSEEMKKKKREFIKKLETITPDDFFRFLNAKNVTVDCPGCGLKDTQITASSGKINLQQLFDGEKDSEFMTYFRLAPGHPGDSDTNYYYKSYCENCGFITMHAVTPVLNWLALQEKQGDPDDEQL
ncbi:TPA: hypothetical protein G8N23_000031 [Salmonella enterica]|uniref:Uncharacterized protein n=1 Tax=Salmonella enterica TaxID=28901 RepID=A0A747X930_SALER|nr:hypothetical protein [Salmonella enterica]